MLATLPPKTGGLILSETDLKDLKSDLHDIKKVVVEINLALVESRADREHLNGELKRAFRWLETLEHKLEGVRDRQLGNAWIPGLVTAVITAASVSAIVKFF
jgi:predicted  nucleic acid-binding Zn-ribbon protein